MSHHRPSWDFSKKPLLVFWETTKACLLACRHCRAEAIESPLPGELSYDEGCGLIEEIKSFGKPLPIMIFTGGDLLMRERIFDLLEYADELRIPLAVAPSVTHLLTSERLQKLQDVGVSSISLSLDGLEETHDFIRGFRGTWSKTWEIMRTAVDMGFNIQVNTCVMKLNYKELPEIFSLIKRAGIKIWEVFYLVKVGRGIVLEELDADGCNQVAHFLYDASKYGLTVRTVEAPFFRRVVLERSGGSPPVEGAIYRDLSTRLEALCGPPHSEPQASITPTRDGNGIVFIGYDGTVFPGGFLPLPRGNVKEHSLVDLYRSDDLFKALRNPAGFRGRCGLCEFRDVCGGSRARAYATFGDPLGEDPACSFNPRHNDLGMSFP